MAYEAKERKKENSYFLPYILEYKKSVTNEMTIKCQRIIKFIEKEALIRAEDIETIVFYKKMIGDFNRFIARFKNSSDQ